MKAVFPGYRYSVNFLGGNQNTERELTDFQKENGRLSFVFTRDPLPEKEVDVYVVPAESLPGLNRSGNPRNWVPVLSYGPGELLGQAFRDGCADYLKTPWDPEELFIRVEKNVKTRSIALPWGKINLFPDLATSPFGSVKLSIQEFSILKVLAQKQGDVVPREVLYKVLWGKIKEQSRVVDMHISSIRKKIQTLMPGDFEDTVIKSAHGYGYFIPFPVPLTEC